MPRIALGQVDQALQLVMPDLLQTEYGSYDFLEKFVPESPRRAAGAQTVRYYRMTRTGMFRLMANYSTVAPKVNVYMVPITYDAAYYDNGFDITLQERDAQEFAASNNQPLVVDLVREKTTAVTEAWAEHKDKIYAEGQRGKRMYGMLTHPDVPRTTLLTRLGLTATAADNIGTIAYISSLASERTRGRERSSTLILPPKMLADLGQQVVGASGETSTLKFILENNPYIDEIDSSYSLVGRGPNGGDLAICYDRNESKVVGIIPKELTRENPQEHGHNIQTLFHGQCAGVHFLRPMSATIVEFPAAA
jgi:hypothetical protein